MAFIVIAIVAAILLITAVRSHASSGVLDSDTIRPAVAAFTLSRP